MVCVCVCVSAPFYAANSPTAIDGEYIVVFKKEIGDDIGKFWFMISKLMFINVF